MPSCESLVKNITYINNKKHCSFNKNYIQYMSTRTCHFTFIRCAAKSIYIYSFLEKKKKKNVYLFRKKGRKNMTIHTSVNDPNCRDHRSLML